MDSRNAFKILTGKSADMRPVRRENASKMYIKQIIMDLMKTAQAREN